MVQNAILPTGPDGRGSEGDFADGGGDVAARIAGRTLARRGADYASEVRRLLDAALELIRLHGTAARPRVADIVAASGLSNEAFYRHFPSKAALVAALVEDGTDRLAGYLAHQMAKEATPEGRVRRWVEGILSQADGEIAAATLAVLWNGGEHAGGHRNDAAAIIGALLVGPLTELGGDDPGSDAVLLAHAMLGRVTTHLWAGTGPTPAEVDHLVAFCRRAGAAGRPG